MLNEEEYSSDTSDEDFVPEGDESNDEQMSEGEVDNEAEDEGSDSEVTRKKKKNRRTNVKNKKNPLLRTVNELKDSDDDPPSQEEHESKQQQLKNEDNLWADFLADVEDKPVSPPRPKPTKSWAHLLGTKKENQKQTTASYDSSTDLSKIKTESKASITPSAAKPSTVKVTKVFEFAGEEVKVEEEVPLDSVEAKRAIASNEISSESTDCKDPRRPLGLSGLIGVLDNKKRKLTTLEKTKIDWGNFKTSEGIEDELETHKKSKSGFLEKQEFLERADHRQFEIERAMRMKKRSNR